MLGNTITDPTGIEGDPGLSRGLGLLDVETTLGEVKELRVENAVHVASGLPIAGYHMHMGVTAGPDRTRPFSQIGSESDGARSKDRLVTGTYLHGVFASDAFRHAFLNSNADRASSYEAGIDAALDHLAAHLNRHLDIDQLLSLAAQT